MGYRLSKITTRTGDDGSTGLGDGSRVSKNSTRVHALGEVDELNSMIGLLLTETLPPAVGTALQSIQNDLFDLGSELAVPGYSALSEERLLALEAWTAEMNATLPPLVEFILPGGSRAAAYAHLARAIARRAERALIALEQDTPEHPLPNCRRYLNRLSDTLFVLARNLNQGLGVADVLWQSPRSRAAQA